MIVSVLLLLCRVYIIQYHYISINIYHNVTCILYYCLLLYSTTASVKTTNNQKAKRPDSYFLLLTSTKTKDVSYCILEDPYIESRGDKKDLFNFFPTLHRVSVPVVQYHITAVRKKKLNTKCHDVRCLPGSALEITPPTSMSRYSFALWPHPSALSSTAGSKQFPIRPHRRLS